MLFPGYWIIDSDGKGNLGKISRNTCEVQLSGLLVDAKPDVLS